jgi:hypothetical protein
MTASAPTETDLKYSFLKVKKEKEAILLGINPTNKYQHEILKLIKHQNTIQNAAKGMLFTPNQAVLEQMQMDMKTLTANINQLISIDLTCHVPTLRYDPFTKTLQTVSFFINHPSEDKNYSLINIFEELVAYSFMSFKSWYENKDPISRDEFKEELLWQIQAKPNDDYRGKSNMFNPLKKFYDNQNGITVIPEMIDYMSKNLTQLIIESKMGVEILGHGLLILKSSEILDIFETAESFAKEKLINPLLEDINFKFRMEPIVNEEKLYMETESFPRKTSKFIVSQAKEAKLIKSQLSQNSFLFPGSLGLEIIIKLEDLAEEKYSVLWKEDCEKVKQDFKRVLTTPSTKWSDLILFLKHEDSFKYHPDVWKELLNDPDLFYSKWNIPKNIIHVFTGREFGFFKTIVLGISGIPESDIWKMQAFVNLIEKHEKKLRSLLADNNFSVLYSELLKKIYTQYIPWYLRFFLVFPFSIFLDGFLENAKQKIKDEQANLSKNNENQFIKMHNDMVKEKLDRVQRAKDEFLYQSIKSTLDSYYFHQKKIPTVDEIKQFYADEDAFNRVLKKKNFKIYKISVKDGDDAEVLLYPAGDNWEVKKNSLISCLDTIVTEKNPHITMNFDKIRHERAAKLLELLKK